MGLRPARTGSVRLFGASRCETKRPKCTVDSNTSWKRAHTASKRASVSACRRSIRSATRLNIVTITRNKPVYIGQMLKAFRSKAPASSSSRLNRRVASRPSARAASRGVTLPALMLGWRVNENPGCNRCSLTTGFVFEIPTAPSLFLPYCRYDSVGCPEAQQGSREGTGCARTEAGAPWLAAPVPCRQGTLSAMQEFPCISLLSLDTMDARQAVHHCGHLMISGMRLSSGRNDLLDV